MKDFVWTDELAMKWARMYLESSGEVTLDGFKDHNQRSPIIRINGKNLFEGDIYYYVLIPNYTTYPNHVNLYTSLIEEDKTSKIFLTKEDAEKWIKENKPKYSFKQMREAIKVFNGYSGESAMNTVEKFIKDFFDNE